MPVGARGMLAVIATLEGRSFRRFFASLTLLSLVAVAALFAGFTLRSRHLLRSQMLAMARAEFATIQLMRIWNSNHGGVWVQKQPGTEESPFLEVPDLATTDGRVLVHRNHAVMIHELADLASSGGFTSIHMTSLRPLNPANRAVGRERDALQAFEAGEKEYSWTEERGGRRTFSYTGRLLEEPSCQTCHSTQGYHTGDVRGGITVSFDTEAVERKMSSDLIVTSGVGLLAFLALVGPMALLVKGLRGQERELRRQLEDAATTDALTGLANRRHLVERFAEELDRHQRLGRRLGCLLLDLDHFKEVNDRWGHLAGDQVLRGVSAAAREAVRPYDIVGRYGGEELMVLLPEAEEELAVEVAERLRELVLATVSVGAAERGRYPVTVSVGVTCSNADDDVESVIARADQALYRAKQAGRNRVSSLV